MRLGPETSLHDAVYSSRLRVAFGQWSTLNASPEALRRGRSGGLTGAAGNGKLIVFQIQVQNRLENTCRLIGTFISENHRLTVQQFPVPGLFTQRLLQEPQCLLVLIGRQQRIDGPDHASEILFFRRDLDQQCGRLFDLAFFLQQLRQTQWTIFAGYERVQLLLMANGSLQIAVGFAQLDQLHQQLRIASLFCQQFFQFLACTSVIADRLMGLGQAKRHVPLLVQLAAQMFEPFEQPVELIGLQIQLGKSRNDGQPILGIRRLFEGSPVQFDGLVCAKMFCQCCGQQLQSFQILRGHAHRTSQRLQPLF